MMGIIRVFHLLILKNILSSKDLYKQNKNSSLCKLLFLFIKDKILYNQQEHPF